MPPPAVRVARMKAMLSREAWRFDVLTGVKMELEA